MVLHVNILFLVIYENKEFKGDYKVNIQGIANESSE